jgi:Immunity protein 52
MKPGLGYYNGVFRGPRQETPEELAARWIKLIARLQAIDPIFAHWYIWTDANRAVPFFMEVEPLAEEIAAHVGTSDDGEPQPYYGYQLFAHSTTEMKRGPRNFTIHMHAGSPGERISNRIGIDTDYGVVPDPSIVTFKIFKDALLALAETFEGTAGLAYPTKLMDFWPDGQERNWLELAWITYVAPRFAALITPPSSAIVERQSDGGLLMAATDETFLASNPEHMAVAREIAAAAAPFNDLPYPWDETPSA